MVENNRQPDIEFFVPGIPRPGGSKKGFYNKKSGRVIIVDAGTHTKPWRQTIMSFALGEAATHGLLQHPGGLSVCFFLPRPKKHYGTGKNSSVLKPDASYWHSIAPDTTKLMRALEDALTGILWRDDSQVVWQIGCKVYSEMPGARVRIYHVKNTDTDETVQGFLPLFQGE